MKTAKEIRRKEAEWVQELKRMSNSQIERLRKMHNDLFIPNTEVLKPGTTLEQLQYINQSLLQIQNIYNEALEEVKRLNEERNQLDNSMISTRNSLIAFSKKYKIEIPEVVSKLYLIKQDEEKPKEVKQKRNWLQTLKTLLKKS